MPWFECKKSSAADLLEMKVDVKPFCASPDLFPGQGNHQQQCWPVEEAPGAGETCSGEYPILDIIKVGRCRLTHSNPR